MMDIVGALMTLTILAIGARIFYIQVTQGFQQEPKTNKPSHNGHTPSRELTRATGVFQRKSEK